MSEISLDQLVQDFAGLLTALTEGEKALLDRVRHLRHAQHEAERSNSQGGLLRAAAGYPNPSVAAYAAASAPPGAVPSHSAPLNPLAAFGPPPAHYQPAPLVPPTATSERLRASIPTQQWPAGPAPAPRESDWASAGSLEPPPSPSPSPSPSQSGLAGSGHEQGSDAVASGRRDYNYFAELDEKLTGLRQRYLE